MTTKELKVRVKHAYLSATEWVSKNPILQAGEFGIENDTQKFKIGDGVTKWSNLPYVSGADSGIVVDTALSPTSTNPVQNKVINSALLNKLGKTETASRAKGDSDGNNIKETYAKKANLATVASTGNYDDLTNIPSLVKRVNGITPDTTGNVTIAVGDNYILPTASSDTLGGVKIGSGLTINTSGVLSADVKESTLTAYAKTTDLSAVAKSGSYNDLSDKPVIPSAYILPYATSSVLGGVKIGSNISVSYGTISLTKNNVTSALGYTPPMSDTTYGNATSLVAGLMSSTDKSKLDNIENNANNYIHPPTHPASMITGLADVATSGSYNDLTDKPNIPASAIVDSELSSTSVNPVQNKVINAALNNKLPLTGGTVTGGIIASNFQTGTATANYFQCRKFRGEGDANSYYHAIDFGYSGHDSVDFYEYDPSWNFYKCTTGTKSGAVLVGNINGNGWNGGARLTGAPTAPTAAVGTNTTQIATTAFVHSAIPTNVSSFTNDAGYLTQHQSLVGYVKTVNNTAPDSSGNVTIAVSGGGVSTSESNTWTGKQTFQKMKFNFESYNAPRISGATDNPSSSVAVYNVQGNFTLDMSTLAGLLSNGDATVFTAYITANGSYTLSITNAGTLKYAGSANDLAITANGLLLNILLIKSSSGVLSSVAQASTLS